MAGPIYCEPTDFQPMARGLRLVVENHYRSREDQMPKLPEPDQFQITLTKPEIDELRTLCATAAIELMDQKELGILNRKGVAKCAGLCDLTTKLREAMPISSGAGK